MKTLLKVFAIVAVALFVVATIIKFTRGTTYKEAVGIMEELCREIREKCVCCRGTSEEEA